VTDRPTVGDHIILDGRERLRILEKCLYDTTFFTDPASSRFHCNYEGGLKDHSYNVMYNLENLTERLKLVWKDERSWEIVALAHDVCKIGAYVPDGKGGYAKNPNQPKGHGDLSVARVKQWIELTEEEELCIRWHMGAYDDRANWNEYNKALQKYPNVLWTHTADMMATHFDEVE